VHENILIEDHSDGSQIPEYWLSNSGTLALNNRNGGSFCSGILKQKAFTIGLTVEL